MIGQKMFLIKTWSLWLVARDFVPLHCPDPNSQPSSHNYYHHLDLTLLLCALSTLQCAHRVRGS